MAGLVKVKVVSSTFLLICGTVCHFPKSQEVNRATIKRLLLSCLVLVRSAVLRGRFSSGDIRRQLLIPCSFSVRSAVPRPQAMLGASISGAARLVLRFSGAACLGLSAWRDTPHPARRLGGTCSVSVCVVYAKARMWSVYSCRPMNGSIMLLL